MPFIKTIQEVKEVLPDLVSNLNKADRLPNYTKMEAKYIVPLIGNALYVDLLGKYDDSILGNEELTLVKHIRLVIGAYGFLESLPARHVVLSDTGVRVHSTGDMQKAVGWEYKELKQFLRDQALDGTEVLLGFLWENRSKFTSWTEDPAFKRFTKLLIRTGTDFNECYTLHQPNRTYYALRSTLADAQAKYLESGIGPKLVSYFAQLDSPGEVEADIIEQLKKGLATFTIKHACERSPVRLSESGFTIVSEFGGDREGEDAGRSAAPAELIKQTMRACDRDGKDFLSRAKAMLIEFRKSNQASSGFIEAFDAGPLKGYVAPSEKTSGNERRKIYRF